MIDIATAKQLLDLGHRIGAGQRAQEQLEGAVALHNLLERHRVAYLADEVGMGKTYVALGALALFRHFNPGFRVLVIAPRENIQDKWIKELENFVAFNVRFPDLRMKALDGGLARPAVKCSNLIHLVREVGIDPDRDFFARLSSFSIGLADEKESWRRMRDRLRAEIPWLADEVFDLRTKSTFKDQLARAICCSLPVFDLVIVDEGHNLKHGIAKNVAARNRVMALALGHTSEPPPVRLFPGYGPRASRVLFLSATPVEDSYKQLWNQLNVLGHGEEFKELADPLVGDEIKKKRAAEFLIRRVTMIRAGGQEYTKNLYRREWRAGGVAEHDEPLPVANDRQRLVVALVQKKVSELLGDDRFNGSFQIGMLASFESFLETTRVKRLEEEDGGNFDDPEQADHTRERIGIDVDDVNRLSRNYRRTFGAEMPHPKMDAVVESLVDAWTTGRKTLVFVRRVRSVTELKRKLDERYDEWILGELRTRLPAEVLLRFEDAVTLYRAERQQYLSRDADMIARPQEAEGLGDLKAASDVGAADTFFAWFFSGEGPKGFVSGANIQKRFIQRGTVYSTFFEHNYAAEILRVRPEAVEGKLAEVLGVTGDELRRRLRESSRRFLSRAARVARADRFEAVQAAAIELLKEHESPFRASASIVWQERFEFAVKIPHADEAPEIGASLATSSFWTEIEMREELRERIAPTPRTQDLREAFRERELRTQLLATAARLGHAFIDFYILTIQRLGSLEPRVQESADDEGAGEQQRIHAYLDLLESQMRTPIASRAWAAFDELAEIATHFELILDVNCADARRKALAETARLFGSLLRQQQPVAGMFGEVNRTVVRQFRMPGYPLVLVSTDLLQEGEDLHTFCSAIQHYGISWTPSSMEQRIGRIDRVRSQTDRRLGALDRAVVGDEMLQVYYPHLEDTVEVLQVRRVIERMDAFLRLMHEGLVQSTSSERSVDMGREATNTQAPPAPIRALLHTSFPIPTQALRGHKKSLAVSKEHVSTVSMRFESLQRNSLPGLDIDWESNSTRGRLLGTARLARRRQPFVLLLQSFGERLLIRCLSPVGRVAPAEVHASFEARRLQTPCRVGAILSDDERSYDLTVEEDVLLAEPAHDDARVALLIRRVVEQADAFEQALLPGKDEPIDSFREDLAKDPIRAE